MGFYGSNDPTNSVKALKEEKCDVFFVLFCTVICLDVEGQKLRYGG